MSLFFNYWSVDASLSFTVLLYLLHSYISRNFDYWQKRNVPFIKPKPFFGNMSDVFLHKYDMGGFFEKLYNDMDVPFFGIFCFSKPALIVKDLNLLKHILVKDFDSFVDRVMYAPEHDPATAHMLFIAKGDEWKAMRSKISPFFSPSKVKSMFGAMDNLAIALSDHIDKNKDEPNLDAKDLSNKYSVDVIAQCVFGIQAKSLENENGEFMRVAHKIFDTRPITSFRFSCYFFFHSFARLFKMKSFDADVVNFSRRVFWDCIKLREEDNVKGNDLMDIIVDLRKNKEFCQRMKFEGDKVIAQAFNFFAAGFETTASTISFTSYSLCLNLDVQRKLRKNIKDVVKKHNGQLTMESLEEMSYLEMAVKETLRRYCPTPSIDRVCNADYKIPGTEVVIEKGTIIILPVFGLQKDPAYFDKPSDYIPERFESNTEDMSYLPFGVGPRMCIGKRFGILSVKSALIRILKDFEVHRTAETPVPVVFSTKALIPQPTTDLSMKFVKVDSSF